MWDWLAWLWRNAGCRHCMVDMMSGEGDIADDVTEVVENVIHRIQHFEVVNDILRAVEHREHDEL